MEFAMKNKLLAAYAVVMSLSLSVTAATETEIDLNAFAQQYFKAMVATQAPDAAAQDLENYLALLTDDIGHSHLPYVTDDSRQPDGKQAMRKGMTFYLGAHTEH